MNSLGYTKFLDPRSEVWEHFPVLSGRILEQTLPSAARFSRSLVKEAAAIPTQGQELTLRISSGSLPHLWHDTLLYP